MASAHLGIVYGFWCDSFFQGGHQNWEYCNYALWVMQRHILSSGFSRVKVQGAEIRPSHHVFDFFFQQDDKIKNSFFGITYEECRNSTVFFCYNLHFKL